MTRPGQTSDAVESDRTEPVDGGHVPLADFPLRWRWTDARWSVLPPHALADIRPFSPARARDLDRHSAEVARRPSLRRASIDSSLANDDAVREWLRGQGIDAAARVTVSWDPATAAEVSWGVLLEFWSDFCYPSSDDVTAWPASEAWLLSHHHEGKITLDRLAEG